MTTERTMRMANPKPPSSPFARRLIAHKDLFLGRRMRGRSGAQNHGSECPALLEGAERYGCIWTEANPQWR